MFCIHKGHVISQHECIVMLSPSLSQYVQEDTSQTRECQIKFDKQTGKQTQVVCQRSKPHLQTFNIP